MKVDELCEALREGKAVACDSQTYTRLENGKFVVKNQKDNALISTFSYLSLYAEDIQGNKTAYRIYERPILTEEERIYLAGVLKPLKKSIISIKICKYKYSELNEEYLVFYIVTPNNAPTTWTFPWFEAGTMYKGMKLNKNYTLEELGL